MYSTVRSFGNLNWYKHSLYDESCMMTSPDSWHCCLEPDPARTGYPAGHRVNPALALLLTESPDVANAIYSAPAMFCSYFGPGSTPSSQSVLASRNTRPVRRSSTVIQLAPTSELTDFPLPRLTTVQTKTVLVLFCDEYRIKTREYPLYFRFCSNL